MKWITGLFWVCFAAACGSHVLGNPAAINGIIGAGACAVACTILAWIERP